MSAVTLDLKDLVALVERKLADHEANTGPKPEGFGPQWSAWRDRYNAGLNRVRNELEREAGAKFRHDSCDYTMLLGGVRTSCTAGYPGLFTNWLGAARRRLGEAGA